MLPVVIVFIIFLFYFIFLKGLFDYGFLVVEMMELNLHDLRVNDSLHF